MRDTQEVVILDMEKLLAFIKSWLDEKWERKSYCKTCEVLRSQLDREIFEKQQLLNRFVLIEKTPAVVSESAPMPVMPKIVPWRVQRELLEQEDRAKAQAMRRHQEDVAKASVAKSDEMKKNEPIENGSISISELEKELGVQ